MKKITAILLTGISLFVLIIISLVIFSSLYGRYVPSSSFETLKSLPYLSWVPAETEKTGVIKHNPALSCKGVNIYNADNSPEAYLIDMSGKVLHKWSGGKYAWHHAEICENGDLLGISQDRSLVRLDWDSHIKWVKNMRFHHDLDIAENKDIYVLARKDRIVFKALLPVPVLNDYIIVLSSRGEIKKEISLYKILKEKISAARLFSIYGWIIRPKTIIKMRDLKKKYNFVFEGWNPSPPNIFHTNSIEIINRDVQGLCKKGNILICVRELNLIGILDMDKEKLIWGWGPGNLDKPHNPTLLENGNILIFDNGWSRAYSRIIELNPLTEEILWEYKSWPVWKFSSDSRGASQRLNNGNTLITESDKGRVFEITPSGKIVWEFFSPDINSEDGTRRAIYRMMRITDTEKYPFLKDLKNRQY